MLNHTINFAKLKFIVWFDMEAIPKFDIKSVIKSDISIKPTKWIGHKAGSVLSLLCLEVPTCMCCNPSIYNIIRWFAGPMGQMTRRPSI